MKKYDYIMIGSGPSIHTFTNLLAKRKKTALIIEGDQFGGICPNYGCALPSLSLKAQRGQYCSLNN